MNEITKIEVLFKNSLLIAVDKPHGISIHNAEDPINLMTLLKNQLNLSSLFPVHRLDKETSGIQIFALTSEAASKYATAFQDRETTKIYFGIVRGQLKQPSGIWNQPLTDKAEGRKNPQGLVAQRVPCQTNYEVTQGSKYFSLCRFHLFTGRQHQIRKHAAINGHHLVGDLRYGDSKYNEKMISLYHEPRMFLHCQAIQILDLYIESKIPECFEALFKN